MFVGLGSAGKTSLAMSLRDPKSRPTLKEQVPEITDGIIIKDWMVDLQDQSKLTFSVWDFAGQGIYLNTHQFFLGSRAVYLLVWNVRMGSEYSGLEFWLSSIKCYAPTSPILVVGTHIDQVKKKKNGKFLTNF
jgi:leucine-rich repeat kinase 2